MPSYCLHDCRLSVSTVEYCGLRLLPCACVCACVRACVRAGVRACERAYAHICTHAHTANTNVVTHCIQEDARVHMNTNTCTKPANAQAQVQAQAHAHAHAQAHAHTHVHRRTNMQAQSTKHTARTLMPARTHDNCILPVVRTVAVASCCSPVVAVVCHLAFQ